LDRSAEVLRRSAVRTTRQQETVDREVSGSERAMRQQEAVDREISRSEQDQARRREQ
jgi:hypothetical protein